MSNEPKLLKRLIILGNPKAQQRHRHFRHGKFSGQYDPSEGDKADLLTQVCDNAPDTLLTGSLKVDLNFYFPRLKGHFGTGKNAGILKKSAPKWHTVKPDCDNCAKLVLDVLNGIFWTDDNKICNLEIMKLYSDKPRTEIWIYSLEDF